MRGVTRLSPAQFALVVSEVESMFFHQADPDYIVSQLETNEGWRVMKMFADGRFDLGIHDFPERCQRRFAELGPVRRHSYPQLIESCRVAMELDANHVMQIEPIGELQSKSQTYNLLKFVSKPPSSPYSARLPICLVDRKSVV